MEEQLLKGLREVYKQNQELKESLNRLQQFVEGALGRPTIPDPNKKVAKRPWENGWAKDKVAKTEPEQNTNTEEKSDLDNVKEVFKF